MANEKTPLLKSGENGDAAPKVGFAPSQEYVCIQTLCINRDPDRVS